MPKFDVTINLPGFTVKKVRGYNPIVYEVRYQGKASCPHCRSKGLRKKDRFVREVNHETVGLRTSRLRFCGYKYQCRCCGRYFRQRFDGILPWQRSSEPLRKQIYHLHTKGVSRRDLGEQLGCSDNTISRWYQHVYHLEDKKRLSMRCPEILGIDEHRFNKRIGYMTTFCDLKKHRIFDVTQGKSTQDLASFLESLEGKERVKVVCMDMSDGYRSIIRRYFPNAKIVADRFHVVRLVLYHLIKTCQTIDEELKTKRGITKLLRMHASRLTAKQSERLKAYFAKQKAIEAIYLFKEKMMTLLLHKKQTKIQCKEHIAQFLQTIEQLKQISFDSCKTLAKSLLHWQEEIVRMWRFSKSNGITEGFHRIMKLIQRRAFGFRNVENYRMRVRVLCS